MDKREWLNSIEKTPKRLDSIDEKLENFNGGSSNSEDSIFQSFTTDSDEIKNIFNPSIVETNAKCYAANCNIDNISGLYTIINKTGRKIDVYANNSRIYSANTDKFVVNLTNITVLKSYGWFSDGWTENNKNELLNVLIINGDWSNKEVPLGNKDSKITKLDNSTNGFITDLNIKGKTLVNYINNPITEKRVEGEFAYTVNYTPGVSGGKITFINRSDKRITLPGWKNNKWDLVIDVLPNSYKVYNIPADIEYHRIDFLTEDGWLKSDISKFNKTNFMILEGDWTNKEIPVYFEGIKSVGENENNKIEIVTTKSYGATGDKLSIQLGEPLRLLNNNVYDEIKDNKVIRRIKSKDLDGSLNWSFGRNYLDKKYKWIHTPLSCLPNILATLVESEPHMVLNHRGTKLINKVSFLNGAPQCEYYDCNPDEKVFGITVLDSHSGWGENYTPTPDEIKAYFYGWKMSTTEGLLYNGVGNKCWTPFSRVGMNTDSQLTVPIGYSKYPFTPYKLYYQLANQIIEPLNKPLILSTTKDCSLQLNNSITPIISGKYGTNLGGGLESVVSGVKNMNDTYNVPSNPNLLINGDFQVWQRGEIINCQSGVAYVADRWRNNYQEAVYSKVINTSPCPSRYAMQIINKSSSNCYCQCNQMFEENFFKTIESKTLTLSFWVRGVGNNVSIYFPNSKQNLLLTTEWQHVTTTFIAKNLTGISFGTSLGTKIDSGYELTGVKLELGDKATPFVPRLYGEELMLCQRYYFPLKSQQWLTFIDVHGGAVRTDFYLPTKMRIEPSLKDASPLPEVFTDKGWITVDKVNLLNPIENKISIAIESTSLTYGDSKASLVRNLPNLDAEIY